jgi:hypothetical protein
VILNKTPKRCTGSRNEVLIVGVGNKHRLSTRDLILY